MRSVGRPTGRSVEGRVSGPGDRAPKSVSLREPTLFNDGRPRHPVRRMDVDVVLPRGPRSSARSQSHSAREPGDLEVASPLVVGGRQPREGDKPQAAAVSVEKSDEVIVPKKSAKTWVTPVESMEGRAEAKGKSAARNALSDTERSRRAHVPAADRQRAKGKPEGRWTNLLSHIRVPLLEEAYQRLRRGAAAGVDGVTWDEYGERLDERLLDLEDRVHRGSYHPQPVRRVHIPKEMGRRDRSAFRRWRTRSSSRRRGGAGADLRGGFLGFSYGFRPKRSPHDALDALGRRSTGRSTGCSTQTSGRSSTPSTMDGCRSSSSTGSGTDAWCVY